MDKDTDEENKDSNLPQSDSEDKDEKTTPKKKAKKGKPHTLSKEELTALIDSGKFWGTADENDKEEDNGDTVYDDCNQIRRKINTFLRSGRLNQTKLLKFLGVNSNSFHRFMNQKGINGGSGNGMYTAAYDFFERLRVLEGKAKTQKRLGAEQRFGPGGRPTETQPRRFIVPNDTIIVLDEWGIPKVLRGMA
jgi:hypothetical protein